MHNKHHTRSTFVHSESSPKEIAKFILVILGIFVTSYVLTKTYDSVSFEEWSRWFMGVFFVVFASFKFIGYKMFSVMFAGYDILAKKTMLYAHAYPFIELALGLAYIFDIAPTPRDIITVIIMGIGSTGVIQELKKRSDIHCACLGNVIKLPLTTVSLVEDVGMGLMALAMLLFRIG